jgi:hypothetical protein
MTRLSPRPTHLAMTVTCAALAVLLTACSSSGPSPAHHSHSHPAAASPSAQPSSGSAAVAAVRNTWQSFFNGAIPIPRRLTLLQDGQAFSSFVAKKEKTSLGQLVFEATATVSSVTLKPPSAASVVYTILLSGKPLAKNLHGSAVYSGGSWRISSATFCALARLAFGSKPGAVPAACAS